jgi:hypothetical protein
VKIIAFTALHYGMDYLDAAIRSVAPFVHEWYFAYSPVGSHGTRTNTVCPESESMLRAEAERSFSRSPLQRGFDYAWYTQDWSHEGEQRDSVYTMCPDADLIIVVDADEVWAPEAVADAIRAGAAQTTHDGLLPFWHFWRSFGWYCTDGHRPVRLIRPDMPAGNTYHDLPPVYHFGYAQRLEIVRYKIGIHGHRTEWRNDWLARFEAWTPAGPHNDLHPVVHDFWTARPFAREQMPAVLTEHPYYGNGLFK